MRKLKEHIVEIIVGLAMVLLVIGVFRGFTSRHSCGKGGGQ